MLYSDLMDAITGAGYPPEVKESVTGRIIMELPEIGANLFSQALSTIQPDPELPNDWARAKLDELGISYDLSEY